jgi:Leu/Phe-tRNA-protein transferase
LKSATIIGASFFWYESDVRAVYILQKDRFIKKSLTKIKKGSWFLSEGRF